MIGTASRHAFVRRRLLGWVLAALTGIGLAGAARSAAAQTPLVGSAGERVQFDVGSTVSCRDVTGEAFASIAGGDRLVEARFSISSLVHRAQVEPVEVLYRIWSPRRTVEVYDFQPRTTLATDVVGNLAVERRQESGRQLGGTVSGSHEHVVKGTISGDLGSKSQSSVQYELLPPLELVAASGTIDRGSGVYFRLQGTSQTSLEGARDFAVTLRVPHDWRADWTLVECVAYVERRGLFSTQPERVVVGSASFVVGLYAEQDAQARRAALAMVAAERQLRRVAERHRREIERHWYPTVAHRVGALLEVVSPPIPRDWLDQLIYEPELAQADRMADHLPDDVRLATLEFTHAKAAVAGLSGR